MSENNPLWPERTGAASPNHPAQPAQPAPQAPYADVLPYSQMVAPPTSGAAVASLVLGILSLLTCFIPLIPGGLALVFGIIGINRTRPGAYRGRGLAIAGTVMGSVSLFLSLLMFPAILLPSLNRARESANRVVCASNLRMIGQAARIYAIDDPNALFPPDFDTLLANSDLVPEVFVCPSTDHTVADPGDRLIPGENLSYIYLGSGVTDSVPSPQTFVLAYEPVDNHDREGANFLYADGSVRFIPRTQARAMIASLEAGQNPPVVTTTPPGTSSGVE